MPRNNMVIIQARMGSHRLPGKSMETIGEVPLINHVLRRALAISQIERVVVATTYLEEDDALVSYVDAEFGIQIHRGDPEDVRSRFTDVINKFHPKNIIIFIIFNHLIYVIFIKMCNKSNS